MRRKPGSFVVEVTEGDTSYKLVHDADRYNSRAAYTGFLAGTILAALIGTAVAISSDRKKPKTKKDAP